MICHAGDLGLLQNSRWKSMVEGISVYVVYSYKDVHFKLIMDFIIKVCIMMSYKLCKFDLFYANFQDCRANKHFLSRIIARSILLWLKNLNYNHYVLIKHVWYVIVIWQISMKIYIHIYKVQNLYGTGQTASDLETLLEVHFDLVPHSPEQLNFPFSLFQTSNVT